MFDINFLRRKEIELATEEPTAVLTTSIFSIDKLGLLKYARILVYALVFLTPLFFLPFTSEILEYNKQLLIFVLSVAGLILYLWEVIRTGHLVFKKGRANYAVLIFIAAVLAAVFFSDFRYQSIFGGFDAGFQQSLFVLFSFAVLFFLIVNIFGINSGSAKEDVSRLLKIFSLSLFLGLLLGTLEILGAPLFKLFGIDQSYFNSVGTTNSLGVISALLLVLYFSKFGPEKNNVLDRLFKYLRIPAVALSLFLLLVINWWVLWVIMISGMVFILISNSLRDWRILSYFLPTAVILLAVMAMLLNFNLRGVLGIDLPIEISPSFNASFEIAKDVLVKSPLFGIGPENFPLAYDLYKPTSINNTIFWNVRFSESSSEAFSSLISYGILGFLAFIFMIWTGFRLGLKNYNLLGIFVVLVAAWALYPFNITIGFAFWLLFGLLALSASKREDELVINLEKSPKHSLITSVSFVCALVLAFVGFYFVILHYIADIKFSQAMTTQEIDQQTQMLIDTVNLNKDQDLYSRVLNNVLISRINQELANINRANTESERQAIVDRIEDFSATAINLSTQLTDKHGQDSVNWFSRALVYENLINVVGGSDEWAIRMYQEYSKVSPKNPLAYLRIGNIYIARADFLRQAFAVQGSQLNAESRANVQTQILASLQSAEENYKKAIELKPNYILAIYNLGVVYERQGRVKESITQLEITKSANPLDANIAFQLGLLYYRDNQKENSFNELQRAVTIFSNFSNARWYLALLYEERGELDSALEELYKIEEFNPDNEILQTKISELEAGRRSIPPQRITGVQPLEEAPESQ